MFWGLVLKANKRYSQIVTKAFHVSHATLDLATIDSSEKDAVVQVWLTTDESNHLLCNVSKQTSHVPLDLAFSEGETIAFYSKGTGTVHLSGFLMPDDDDFGYGMGEEEEDESLEDEETTLVKPSKQLKDKNAARAIKAAAAAAAANQEDESDDSDESGEEDDSDDDLDMLEGDDLDEEEDDDDDEEDEEDEDDSDDDDEEIEQPKAKQPKLDKSAKQNGLPNGKAVKAEKKEQPQKKQKENANQQKQQPNQQQKKPLAQGVIIEDIRVGKGPEAKAGKRVQVYYEGRLKSNNKVFDSSKSGEGFKFQLGRGDVIRGWDIGVANMKVGGKRRITCPPHAAYGQKGSPPVIPPNATLVFDVELRGVN